MTTTDPASWTRTRGVFEALCEVPAREREYLLEELDPALARGVRALLEADARASVLDEVPDLGAVADAPATSEAGAGGGEAMHPADLTGRDVDGFHVLSRLAEGGMATVYRVQQEGEFFALKVLKPELRTRSFLARFRQESSTLRGLEHPYVARWRAAGELADGRPYLVTELVEGPPIDVWCAREGLTLDARLVLFLRVLDAVHYAHRHLVVHRDLKPSNILVDAQGAPHVLDFGIAKLLDPALDPAWTDVLGRSPLTPAFASPEQVRGDAITTASDVYSLGVVLYHLATGRGPYEVTAPGREALERAVLEAEPLALREPDLPRDLATILGCALQKNPELRYPTIEHFADDLRRLRANEPLRARREPLGRRLVKVARRHPLTTAAGLGLVTLAAGAFAGTQQNLARVRASETIAWRAHSNAVRATNVLADVLEHLARAEADTEPLASAWREAERVLDELGDAPEAEGRLRLALGRAESAWGRPERAEEHARRALELVRSTRGFSWRDVDAALALLIELRAAVDPDDAIALSRERCTLLDARGPEAREVAARARARHDELTARR